MYHQALHIGHVGQQREDTQVVDKGPSLFLSALDFEGEDTATTVGEELLVECVVRVRGQRGMVNLGHLGVMGQEVDDALGVVGVALYAQTERLQALEQYPGVEGADGGTRVAQYHGADAGYEGSGPGHVGKDGSVIRGVGLGQRGVLVGIGLPVKLAAIYDDATQRATVSADKLGSRVYHHVGAVLQGPYQIRCAKGVVYNDDGIVAVGYLADAVYIGYAGVGVAEGLNDDSLGVGTERGVYLVKVGGVYDGRCHALGAQRVLQQVECAAIEVVGSYNVVTVLGYVLQRVGHGGCTRSHGQSGYTTLKRGYAVFEHGLCRVGQSAVDVTCVAQAEAVCSMLRVAEHIRCGLIDRHST